MRTLALTLAAAACLLGSLVAASSASAFVGEAAVLTEVGGHPELTEAAKSVIERPTFLTENVGEAAAFAGDAEAGAAASVFESAAVLPALGSVLAFGVGTVVGSEICHVFGIEGCWYFHSNGPDPSTEAERTWTFKESAPVAEGPAWQYYWTDLKGAVKTGVYVAPCPVPSGVTGLVQGTPTSIECSGVKPSPYLHYAWRSSLANRGFDYHTSDDPEIGNYAWTAPSTWGEKLAKAVKGHNSDASARVGEKVASELEGSEVEDPYADIVVPSCDGLTAAACVETLEKLGLTPSVAYLGWPEAVIPEVNLDEPVLSLEAQAEQVQKLAPAAGTKVVSGSSVTVTANPKLAGMPLIVPEDPAPGESPEAYRENRLAPQSSGWTVKQEVLGEATLDTEYDPSTVVRPVMKPGTRLNPETTPETTVQVNPSTAPPVGGGGSCEATVGAIDWSPLNQPVGSRFPFGVFAFFVAWIGEWTASEEAPEWEVTVLPPMLGGEGLTITIDLGSMAVIAEVVRVAFIFVSFVGLLWFLGTAAMKVQGDAS